MNHTPTEGDYPPYARDIEEICVQKQFFARIWTVLKRKIALSIEDMEEVWIDTCKVIVILAEKGNLPPLQGPREVFRFACTIAYRQAVDRIRRRKDEIKRKRDFPDLRLLPDYRSVLQPADVCIAHETQRIVSDELARLSHYERTLLEVCIDIGYRRIESRRVRTGNVFEEVKVALAERHMTCPTRSTVYSDLATIRDRLRRRLEIRGVMDTA